MPRALLAFFALSLSSLSLFADEQADLAYSLGVRLGERLQEQVPQLPLPELLKGLREGYAQQPLRLPREQIETLLSQHEQQLEREAEAAPARAEAQFLARERQRPGVRELSDGTLVEELRRGQGPLPTGNNRVKVIYSGYLADGSLFDQSEAPQWFRLGGLIEGWRNALREMPVGSHWRLVVPSSRAYGKEGAGDLIPPNAALVFDVQLLDVAD